MKQAFNAAEILRENIRNLSPYSSARDEYSSSTGIFLDANENSLGTPGAALYNRYPDPAQKEVKKRIGELLKCREEHIFLGNGSDEAIDLLIRAFCEPGRDSILIMPPTYGMYAVAANVNNVGVREVPLTPEFQIDAAAVLASAQDSKLLFLCSPNNPSGNLLDRNSIIELLNRFSGLVILDEAYIDFTGDAGFLSELNTYPNLVILRTFSKAWGMASLRLGMAFASPDIISVLNRIKYPYNVNGVTQRIALDVLNNEILMTRQVDLLIRERDRLSRELRRYDFVQMVFPSDANFLLVRVEDADSLYEFLLQNQIIVRNRSRQLHCENCLRITIGSEYDNQALLDILDGF